MNLIDILRKYELLKDQVGHFTKAFLALDTGVMEYY